MSVMWLIAVEIGALWLGYQVGMEHGIRKERTKRREIR